MPIRVPVVDVGPVVMPFWVVDLRRTWLSVLPASDASSAYGFGVCLARTSAATVREVASLDYAEQYNVRCLAEEGAPPEKQRVGWDHRLPLRISDFKPVLSKKAKWKAGGGRGEEDMRRNR